MPWGNMSLLLKGRTLVVRLTVYMLSLDVFSYVGQTTLLDNKRLVSGSANLCILTLKFGCMTILYSEGRALLEESAVLLVPELGNFRLTEIQSYCDFFV